MMRRFPRLDTYVGPNADPKNPPAVQSVTPGALESTLADISEEVTRDAIERRKIVAILAP